MISIVMAYVNRLEQTKKTLTSISKSKVKNVEIIIVDDFSNEDQSAYHLLEHFSNLNIKIVNLREHFLYGKQHCNPCIAYNIGFKYITYDKVIIQNPECCHYGDVLQYTVDNLTNENYLNFHCYSLDKNDTQHFIETEKVDFNNEVAGYNGSCWYNHTILRPCMYHFTSAITKKNLLELNGFDERFQYGIGFDDDEFLHRIKNKNLSIEMIGDPLVLHLHHENSFGEITFEKVERNKALNSIIECSNEFTAKSKSIENKWYLENIPKIAHFYWGGAPLSYLRYLSVCSFSKLNKDWVIHVYTSDGSNNKTWKTDEQKKQYKGVDYFKFLNNIPNVKIINFDFTNTLVENAHHVHKSDYLRWTVLNTYGGLWSDIDILYINPVCNLIENSEQNKNIDSTICRYKTGKFNFGLHTIGFILSAPNSNLIKLLIKLIDQNFDSSQYQSIGTKLLNNHFLDEKEINKNCNTQCIDLNSLCVYSVDVENINLFYTAFNKCSLKYINNPNIIGFHWYGGDESSTDFENLFNEQTVFNSYNLIRMIYQKMLKTEITIKNYNQNNTDTMLRIYQLYFKDEQKQFLNPLYYHYDNTKNLNPNDREYPLLKKCYEISLKDNIEFWGSVSWNYKFKFSSGEFISDTYLQDYVINNPGYDVYFFNPFTNHVPVIYNVWEQGQWCHKHMITIMEHIFPLIGLSVDILHQPQTRDTICFGSMCVGNKKFWDGYFEFAERFVGAIDNLPDDIKQLFNGPSDYVDNSINYFSFIQERLMSTYLHLNKQSLKILPFHINENSMPYELHELNELKYNMVNRLDSTAAKLWLKKRLTEKNKIYSSDTYDWASIWADSFNNEYSFKSIEHNVNGKRGFTNQGLVNYLIDHIEKKSSLLDLGCGPRLYSTPLQSHCNKILCIDAWPEVNPDIILDLGKIKLTDVVGVKFDYIILLDVIEHLDKQSGYRLLDECKKLVNKKIFLLTPLEEIWTTNEENVDNCTLWCHNNTYDYHKSIWSKKDFKDWVEIKLPGMENFFFGFLENTI